MILLGLIGTGLWTANQLLREQRTFLADQNKRLLLIHQLHASMRAQFHLVPVFVLNAEEALFIEFQKVRKEFVEQLHTLRASSPDDRTVHLIDEIENTESRAFSLAQKGISMRLRNHSAKEADTFFHREAVQETHRLQQSMNDLLEHATNRFEAAGTDLRNTGNRLLIGFALTSLVALLALVGAGLLITKLLRLQRLREENNRLVSEQSQRLAEARKDAIEIVAHDLKNPIASILMLADLWERGVHVSPACNAPGDFVMLRHSAEQMSKLVGNLLDHAKIESGKLVLDRVSCDLPALVASALEPLQLLAQKQRIDLRFASTAKDGRIIGDPSRIEQVLSNLVGNAIKYTEPGGSVTVGVAETICEVSVSVKDTGRGIAKENLSRIFDKYWQVPAASRRGMGLGLAISKSIVDSHGGTLTVKSQSGVGSEFVFSLPRGSDCAAVHSGAERSAEIRCPRLRSLLRELPA